MRAGPLRHRIIIQRPASIRLPSGQPEKTWVDSASLRAEVRDISGRELLSSGAELSEATVRIRLRYRADITSECRVLLRGKVHEIVSVIADAMLTSLELLCKQGVKQ
ncbi:head-tail adaptor [Chimaeribacter arupi]|uniref:phage head closure protein n=1 Tax=Enterobacterales TaxID=91347 RepID=UPI000C7E6C2D|nr:phage head closure protein [Chimaeribacter arupi]PLR48628.1 head-tail adaptor [Chimaeribacter arupi]